MRKAAISDRHGAFKQKKQEKVYILNKYDICNIKQAGLIA